MDEITDEFMHEMRANTRAYTLVLLRATDKRSEPGADAIVWEHGRRNFALRAEGRLNIVCPVLDDGPWAGIGIFNDEPAEVERIMAGDPGVQAGIFTYEIHPVRGFPGDSLPA